MNPLVTGTVRGPAIVGRAKVGTVLGLQRHRESGHGNILKLVVPREIWNVCSPIHFEICIDSLKF